MRDIKFRIYDKELKESHIEELQDVCEDDYWYDGETDLWSVLYDSTHEQERFVALQYTGLKDKNGKEIYEGDILKLHYIKNGTEELIASVIYSEDYAQYVIKDTGYVSDDYEPLCDYEDFEIIGNIYDNPELIKE